MYSPPPPPVPDNNTCSTATMLTVGTTCNYTTYNNSGCTASGETPLPMCAGSVFKDIWFKFIVPQGGRVIIDTQTGTITNGGMAIYSGECGNLKAIECDDDDSNNGLMPMIDKAELTPGDTIYIRFWANGGAIEGTFGICVRDPLTYHTITSCSGSFSDSGGASNSYSANEDQIYFICPDNPGRVKLSFIAFDIEQGKDYLKIYDGNSTASPLLGTYDNNFPLLFSSVQATSNNPTGCLTVVFHSNESTQKDGWFASISCMKPCQTVEAVIASTTPALNGENIDLCQQDTLSLTATANYPQNGTYYIQDDASSTFLWKFGDGDTAIGTTVRHKYSNISGHVIQLIVTDNNGCKSSNAINLNSRISTTPLFNGTFANPTSVCTDQEVTLTGKATPTTWSQPTGAVHSGTTFLPDGIGVSYKTGITFTDFSPNQIVTDSTDIVSICLNMEHSYFGDIGIEISCPNGSTTLLHKRSNSFGVDNAILGQPVAQLLPIDDNTNDLRPGIGFDYCYSPTSTSGYIFNLWNYTNISPYTDPVGNFSPANPIKQINAGTYQAEGSWASLIGCPLNGTWVITVTDFQNRDNGYIFEWGINFKPSLYPKLWSYTPTIDPSTETWHGIDLPTTSANPATFTPITMNTNPYTYSVTDNFGCTYDTTVNISLNSPSEITVNNNGPICIGADLNLSTPISNATNYNWSGPNNFTSTNQNPTIPAAGSSAAGTYTLTVKFPNGCIGTAQTTVTINTIQTISVGDISPLCAGSPLNLTTSAIGATGYQWSGPNNFSSTDQNPSIANATPAATGTYSVTVSFPGGCTGTGETTVTVNPLPLPTIGSNSPLCENTSLDLTASATGATSYQWSGPNNFSSTDQNPSIDNATPAATGTYSVTVTGAGNCKATAETTVDIKTKPVVQITPASAQICNGNDTALTASGGASYIWTPAIGLNQTTGATTTAAPTSTITYTAHGTSNGCNDSAKVTITVIETPSIQIIPASASICPGEQTSFTASGGSSYSWSPSTTLSSDTGNTVTATPTGPISYTVTGTLAGCSGTATATVALKPLPQLQVTPQNPVICNQGSTPITATGADTYHWSPDTTLSTNSGPTVTADPQASCVYTLTGSLNGCKDSIQIPLTVHPLPTVTIQANPQEGCQPFVATFSATSTPAAQNQTWSASNGASSTEITPEFEFPNSGSYNISVSVTDINGCSNSLTELNLITVHPKPEVAFSITPEIGYVSKEITLKSSISAPNSQWQWFFGDGQTATSQSAATNHYYGTPGELTVTHIYTNEFGCSDTASLPYNLIVKITIPNVFTPNNDGFNDMFVIDGLEYIDGAVLKIYNRWGRKIYESDSYKNDWDGADCADGVYYYTLTLPDTIEEGTFSGSISVIR